MIVDRVRLSAGHDIAEEEITRRSMSTEDKTPKPGRDRLAAAYAKSAPEQPAPESVGTSREPRPGRGRLAAAYAEIDKQDTDETEEK